MKSAKSLLAALPIIIAMLLLTSLFMTLVSEQTMVAWFQQKEWIDVLAGASAGSIAAGPPMVSYLLGGELLRGGVGLLAVTAFIVSWVTVGIVQLPMESLLLGKRFAIYRNLSCFVLAIVVSLFTVFTLRLLG
ncbi:MAG: hypothetical protein PVJ39_13850 [Gammaproteobacteria bacterium]|jgi:uncharacterized membrane protein YraQ (UPF0718 family)